MLVVSGASGRLGRAVLPFLLAARGPGGGGPVVLLSRHPARARARFPRLEAAPHIEWIDCDLARRAHLSRLPGQYRHLVHLAGKVRGPGSPRDYWRVNEAGTAHLLEHAARAGCARAVVFSTRFVEEQDSPLQRRDPYTVSKARMERMVRRGPLPWTLLRPALVMSPVSWGIPGGFQELVRAARLPVVPLPWRGEGLVAPLYAPDLAQVVDRCLQGAGACSTWNIAGPAVTLRRLLEAIAARIGTDPRFVPLPHGACTALARLHGRIGGALRRPPAAALAPAPPSPPLQSLPGLYLTPTPLPRALDRCLGGQIAYR